MAFKPIGAGKKPAQTKLQEAPKPAEAPPATQEEFDQAGEVLETSGNVKELQTPALAQVVSGQTDGAGLEEIKHEQKASGLVVPLGVPHRTVTVGLKKTIPTVAYGNSQPWCEVSLPCADNPAALEAAYVVARDFVSDKMDELEAAITAEQTA